MDDWWNNCKVVEPEQPFETCDFCSKESLPGIRRCERCLELINKQPFVYQATGRVVSVFDGTVNIYVYGDDTVYGFNETVFPDIVFVCGEYYLLKFRMDSDQKTILLSCQACDNPLAEESEVYKFFGWEPV